VGSCRFNLENKALRPIGDLTINGIHVDTDILDEYYFMIRWQVSQSKKWLKLSRMMLHHSSKYICSKRYTKRNEVTINWNSSVQKKSNTKETVS
jgi:hypothetical protein